MIPILYETNETNFTTLGIGPLGDAISCVVTEEINGEYELEMTYPVNGIHYSDLKEDRLIYATPSEGGKKQIFKIYQIERPLNGKIIVRAEHIRYLLNKMVVKPFKASTVAEAMTKIKSNIIDYCPFTFTTDKTSQGKLDLVVPIECGKLLWGTEGSILDVYGHGEYEFDNFAVTLKANRGSNNGVTVRYGKNMTELNATIDTTNVYTGVVPYYKDSEDNVTYANGYAVWSSHKSDYTYPLAKVLDLSAEFDAEREAWQQANPDSDTAYHPSSADLISKAQTFLTQNAGWNKSNNIKVSFVNLWQTEEYEDIAVLERVKLGDIVTVIYQQLGVKVTKEVIKTEYDVILERYKSIELGTASTSIASEVANTAAAIDVAAKETRSWMQQSIEHATKLISGGLGGYVVLNRNAAGKPNEILIMDTASKQTARNVWRFNLNGLGHSHSGYNGPFDDIALTMDGHINANLITVGELNANIIKAGILTDDKGKFKLNMDTGELSMKDGTFSGSISASTITGSTITGTTIQNSDKNSRILMDSSSSLKGYYNNTLHNIINMSNRNNNNNDLIIDADHQLHIRTPKIYVAEQSAGTGSTTVYETLSRVGTGDDGNGFEVVTHVQKGIEDCPEVWTGSYIQEEGEVLCILPVFLDVQYAKYNIRNGLWTTDKSTRSDKI